VCTGLVDDKDFAVRSGKTLLALGELGQQLARIRGPKTIVWITTGVWNWLDFPYGCKDELFGGASGSFLAGKCEVGCARWVSDKCVDYGPFLQYFTAQLVRTNTVINSVEVTHENMIPRTDRGTAGDTLEQLARQTGGKVYLNNDVGKAIGDSFANARGDTRSRIPERLPTASITNSVCSVPARECACKPNKVISLLSRSTCAIFQVAHCEGIV
jgi:hypothetical protein